MILKEFDVEFTQTIYEHRSKDVMYKEEFFSVKNEILRLINSQIEE